jgi:hypothetical protein
MWLDFLKERLQLSQKYEVVSVCNVQKHIDCHFFGFVCWETYWNWDGFLLHSLQNLLPICKWY